MLSVLKNFFVDKDIINYLNYVCFKIGKMYCFEFTATDNDSDQVHLLVGAETKYFSSRVKDYKGYHRNKN